MTVKKVGMEDHAFKRCLDIRAKFTVPDSSAKEMLQKSPTVTCVDLTSKHLVTGLHVGGPFEALTD